MGMTPVRKTINCIRYPGLRPSYSEFSSSCQKGAGVCDGQRELNQKRLELLTILTRCVEKKAETLLNRPKISDTPWEAYDLAVRVELDAVRSQGHEVPVHVSNSVVKSVIKIDIETRNGRLRHYRKVREREKLTDEILLHKLEKKQLLHHEFVRRIAKERPEFLGLRKDEIHTPQGYHVLGPRLCLDGAFTMTRADSLALGNLLFAHHFGQPFVIDLGLPYVMEDKEVRSLFSQMREVYKVNSWSWEPYRIHLCGYNDANSVMRDAVSRCENFLWSVTSECFTRLFPRERLVYLSPDSPNVLTEYSHDDIYIVGALIDKRIPKKYSFNKAQELGIRSARFDLGNYLEKTRQKLPYLAFSDVFNVMVDARDTDGNWFYAFQNLITGRKRMFRWRDELEDQCPSLPSTSEDQVIPENFRLKHLEKKRAITKPKRNPIAVMTKNCDESECTG